MRVYQQVLVVSLWIIIGALVLWGFNAFGLLPAKSGGSIVPALEVDFPEVYEIWRRGEAIFVDARPPRAFNRAHIPKAVNVPLRSAEKALSKLSLAKDENLIVYCSSIRCPNAHQLMHLLLRLGYMNVRIFPRGIETWRALGYPLEENTPKTR